MPADDVTPQSRAQSGFDTNHEQLLGLALEATGTGVWVYVPETDQVFFSAAWKEMLGFADEEAPNTKAFWENRIHPDEQSRVLGEVDEFLAKPAGRLSSEYRLRHKDGSFRWVLSRAQAQLNERGEALRIVGTHVDITDRRRAQAELQLSEEKFSKAFHSNPELVGLTTLDEGRFIEVNQAFTDILGYRREDLVGRSVGEVSFWDNLEERRQLVAQLQEKGQVRDYETRYRSKDGKAYPFLANAQLMELDGQTCIIFSARDMTKSHRAETLRDVLYQIGSAVLETKSKQDFYRVIHDQLNRLIDASNFYIGLCDQDKNLLHLPYCNDEKVVVDHFPLKGTCSNFVIVNKRPVILYDNDVAGLVKEGRVHMLGVPSKVWLGVPLLVGDNVLGLIVVQSYENRKAFDQEDLDLLQFASGQVALSIQRKQAEEIVRASEEKFSKAFRSSPDSIIISSLSSGRIIDCNSNYLRTLGYAREDVIGRSTTELDIWESPEARAEFIERIRVDGRVRNMETGYRKSSGECGVVRLSSECITLGGEECLITISRDITKQKRMERDLQLARDNLEAKVEERTSELARANERLQELDHMKSMFLASMSHELRTPLNSILGFTGLLLMGMTGDLDKEQRHQLGLVKNSASHLLELINDILDISKIESGKIEVESRNFSLQDLASEVHQELEPLATERGLDFKIESASGLNMEGDRRRVKQILVNLLSNAIKFTEKGTVMLKLAEVDKKQIQARVCDTGIGLLKEEMELLFKPFQQVDMSSSRRHDGTGLGLYICRKLCDMLAYDLTVESTFGEGSEFTLTMNRQAMSPRVQ